MTELGKIFKTMDLNFLKNNTFLTIENFIQHFFQELNKLSWEELSKIKKNDILPYIKKYTNQNLNVLTTNKFYSENPYSENPFDSYRYSDKCSNKEISKIFNNDKINPYKNKEQYFSLYKEDEEDFFKKECIKLLLTKNISDLETLHVKFYAWYISEFKDKTIINKISENSLLLIINHIQNDLKKEVEKVKYIWMEYTVDQKLAEKFIWGCQQNLLCENNAQILLKRKMFSWNFTLNEIKWLKRIVQDIPLPLEVAEKLIKNKKNQPELIKDILKHYVWVDIKQQNYLNNLIASLLEHMQYKLISDLIHNTSFFPNKEERLKNLMMKKEFKNLWLCIDNQEKKELLAYIAKTMTDEKNILNLFSKIHLVLKDFSKDEKPVLLLELMSYLSSDCPEIKVEFDKLLLNMHIQIDQHKNNLDKNKYKI